jgi:hypothetical protein
MNQVWSLLIEDFIMNRMSYFERFEKYPYKVICETLGEMRVVKQNDIKLKNGSIIDMSFFRVVGLPLNQNWVMKDWNIEFNCVHESIPNALDAFRRHSIDLLTPPFDKGILEYLSHCLCLDFTFCSSKKDSYNLTCLDINDQGAITSVYLSALEIDSPHDIPQNILFINSSIEQFIKTLVLYTIHHDRPANDNYDENVNANEMFEAYIKKIDHRAIQENSETFWSRVLEELIVEDMCF